jgi:hypothetical protein
VISSVWPSGSACAAAPIPILPPAPRLVFDDQRAADGIAEVCDKNTRHDIGRPGRRERHDDLDGAFGIARSLRAGRGEA